MITLFNPDLEIESNAFVTLPIQAQEYIKNILTFKYARIHPFFKSIFVNCLDEWKLN